MLEILSAHIALPVIIAQPPTSPAPFLVLQGRTMSKEVPIRLAIASSVALAIIVPPSAPQVVRHVRPENTIQ